MKRKVVAVMLTFAMTTGLLVGCGSSGESTASSTETAAAGTETAQDSSTTDASSNSGEVVEIEYLNHKIETEPIDAMDALIAKFESENPNIKVIQTTTPDFTTTLTTRAQTNDMPDVFSCTTSNTYELMFEEGLIMDLTGQDFLNNANETTLKLSTYHEKNWRLPYSLSLYGLYVRTDIFEENGLELPTTYEELMQDCAVLKEAGLTPFICPDQDAGMVGQRMERIMGIIDDTDDEFKAIVAGTLDPKDSVVLNTYAQTQIDIANYTTADSLGVDQESSYQNFVNGQGAIMTNGTWALATLKTYDPDIKVAMIPFPNPTGGKTKVPMSIDTSFCISANTEHPEECLKFLEFLSKAENAQIYCDTESSPNVITGVEYGIPEFSAIIDKMNAGETFVSLNAIWPSGLRNEMRDYASSLILDKDKDAFVEAAADLLTSYYTE